MKFNKNEAPLTLQLEMPKFAHCTTKEGKSIMYVDYGDKLDKGRSYACKPSVDTPPAVIFYT